MNAVTLGFANLYPTAADNERVLFGSSNEKSKKNLIKTPRKDDSDSPRSKKDNRKYSRTASANDMDTSGGVGPKMSTPKSKKNRKSSGIESILKNAETPSNDKPKKRNKSVSFVLDDGEVPVVTKKSKKSSDVGPFIQIGPPGEVSLKPRHKNKQKVRNVETEPTVEAMEVISIEKNKKKKKKQFEAQQVVLEGMEVNEEPKKKKKKKQNLAENIAKNLENLSIGENANTLAGLLDEIQVADKPNKRKKKKNKTKATDAGGAPSDEDGNEKSKTELASNENDRNTQNTKKIHKKKKNKSKIENENAEGQLEGAEREKLKWKKRKWNKDKKGEIYGDDLSTTVVVENLPLSMMLSYRKALAEHFAKCGLIKKIGIVELYPTEEPRPVFTTTLQFNSEDAATQALEEDNMELRGARMRVRKLLPPSDTTVVVKCYRGCSQEQMSSIFAPCGKIRSIREVQKGRSARPTAFVEFDGPDAVERALKVAEEVKIGGKKVIVQKFQNRSRRTGSDGVSDKESDQDKQSDQEDNSS